ncbi:hypothetical protein FA10DRAFT_48603 [Acaromyces ingoldii]|uniref:Uncharacterized protein n=1 Tax=Acaromyces ingoldii TaxID=215250 RepID=A0A316Z2L3_9BASI|nr:hypothetical protein FA10DRAFT_48603 [Acaromyces ingoldii]PWN94415.1 hypothetical protein FA10DRAFT_48603 [Acaromyces ingoldii]
MHPDVQIPSFASYIFSSSSSSKLCCCVPPIGSMSPVRASLTFPPPFTKHSLTRFQCRKSEGEKVENDTSYSLLSQRPIPAALPQGEKGKDIRSQPPEEGTTSHPRPSFSGPVLLLLPSHSTFLASLSYLSLSSQSDAMNVLVYQLSVCNFHEFLPIAPTSPHQRRMREGAFDVNLLYFL